MKDRIGLIVLGVILVLGLTSCQIDISKWQTISYDSVMSFKVPENWIVTKTPEGIVFSDRLLDDSNSVVYMAQVTYSLCDDHQMCFNQSLIGSGFLISILDSYQFSNSDVYYKSNFMINETEKEVRQLMFFIDTWNTLDFVVVDDSISTNLLKKILSTKSLN